MMPKNTAAVDGELSVLLELGACVCALPSRKVSRLLLLEEAAAPETESAVITVDGNRFAMWDLAQLLGFVEAAPRTWVLVAIRHGGADVAIAFRAGLCLAVETIGRAQALPPSIFRTRAAAFSGAFDPGALRRAHGCVVGLQLDPMQLLTPDELELSSARIAAA